MPDRFIFFPPGFACKYRGHGYRSNCFLAQGLALVSTRAADRTALIVEKVMHGNAGRVRAVP
jgi:non-ribosomal peptide synthetase component E (peptide arylation enzyme)